MTFQRLILINVKNWYLINYKKTQMKKIVIFSLITSILFIYACSPKYLAKGVVTSSYNKAKTYKTIVLPPVTSNLDQTGNNTIAELAFKDIVGELSSVSALNIFGDYRSMRKKANTYKYGAAENTDINIAVKVAKAAGADIFVVSKISKEKQNMPVRVNIEIYNLSQTLLYSGQGRAANPASLEAETELAIEFALRELKK